MVPFWLCVLYCFGLWLAYYLRVPTISVEISRPAPTYMETALGLLNVQQFYDEQADLIEEAFRSKMPVLAFPNPLSNTVNTYQERVSEWHLEEEVF
jgi:hypothetical protein